MRLPSPAGLDAGDRGSRYAELAAQRSAVPLADTGPNTGDLFVSQLSAPIQPSAVVRAEPRMVRAPRLAWRSGTTLGEHVVDVVGLRSQEQMVGSDASFVVAVVEDVHAHGNRTVVEFPRNAMSRDRAAVYATAADRGVTGAGRSGPFPTGVRFADVRPESLVQRTLHREEYTV